MSRKRCTRNPSQDCIQCLTVKIISVVAGKQAYIYPHRNSIRKTQTHSSLLLLCNQWELPPPQDFLTTIQGKYLTPSIKCHSLRKQVALKWMNPKLVRRRGCKRAAAALLTAKIRLETASRNIDWGTRQQNGWGQNKA